MLTTAFIFVCGSAYSQITLQITSAAASCPGNGSIGIAVTGGTPNYTYSISGSGACLPAAIPPVVTASGTYTFNNLPGNCSYTITVSSQNGTQAMQTVTVADSYPAMSAPAFVAVMRSKLSCSYLQATAAGGRAPFTYTFYQGASATNPAAIVQSGPSNILPLTGLALGLYTVKVRDNCNTERVASVTATNFITPDVYILDSWRPACNEFRLVILPDSFPAGFIVNILDKNGNAISGTTSATGFNYNYPYSVPTGQFPVNPPWGLSNVTPRLGYSRSDLPVPNNPALFPIVVRLTGTDPCQHIDTDTLQYPFPSASTAYPDVTAYTENCNGTICARFNILRLKQQLENYSYPISFSTSQAGPYTFAGNSSNFIYDLCGLQPNTAYWVKTTDPCTARDTAVTVSTPPLTPFGAQATIISYCINPASPAYLATIRFDYLYQNGNNIIQMISGPNAPQTLTGPLVSGIKPGNYVFRLTDNCGTRFQDLSVAVAGTYSANVTAAYTVSQTCVSNCIRSNISGTAGGSLVPNGAIVNFFTRLFTITGSPAPPSGILHTGDVQFCLPLPGKYVVQTTPFFPGITCLTPRSDTITIPAYSLPVVNRLYNVRCAGLNNIAVALPPNSDTGFVFTLLNSGGTAVAGPQSINGNPSSTPPITANPTPNVFSGIAGNPGDNFSVRISDRCGNSATSSLTLPSDVLIGGTVKCGRIQNGSYITDTLRADIIPGASYRWTSPGGIVYGPAPTPNYNDVPAENGVWQLDASVTYNGCTANFHSNISVSCAVVPLRYAYIDLVAAECGAKMSWSTSQETNTRDFNIEVSPDAAGPFTKSETVTAAGFSNTERKYSAEISLPAGTAYVRLRQNDADGNFSYSRVFKAAINCGNTVISIYPNPVRRGAAMSFEIKSAEAATAALKITDAQGRTVYRESRSILPRPQKIILTTALLPAGTYFLDVDLPGNVLKPVKFVVTP